MPRASADRSPGRQEKKDLLPEIIVLVTSLLGVESPAYSVGENDEAE
jgi:hypothetical protein